MFQIYNLLEKIIVVLKYNGVLIDITADNIMVSKKAFKVLRTHPRFTKKEKKILDDILKIQKDYGDFIYLSYDLTRYKYPYKLVIGWG